MNHKQQETFLLLISFFLFLFSCISCEKTTAPVNKLQLTLSAEYVGVTEADLLLQTRNTEANTQYQLFRDDSLVSDGKLIQAETIITDTLLLPAHHYSYQAFLIKDQKRIAQSEEQQVTTLDTTSHDFQWEVIEFPSPYGSGVLYDVAVIDENDIWAVGVIFADSTQPSLPYNAVHWDGQQWELKRIYVEYRSQPNLAPLEGVFVLPDGNIIFSSGLPYIPEGDHWKLYHLWDMGIFDQDDGSVYRIWGTSLQDLYFVGLKGTIVHYNGSSWQKLESPAGASGTDLPIQDIWGAKNENSDQEEIYCIASTKYYGGVSRVMQIEDNKIVEVSNNGLPWSISGIWFKPPHNYYIVGDGIFYSNELNERSKWIELVPDITTYYTHAIRGIEINDIFVVGAYNTVIHFNGMTWKNYLGNTLPNLGYHLSRMDYKGDIVAAVGYLGRDGIILIGKSTKLLKRR
jgi:hypothetical protein